MDEGIKMIFAIIGMLVMIAVLFVGFVTIINFFRTALGG